MHRQLVGRSDLSKSFLCHDDVVRPRQKRCRYRALAQAGYGVRYGARLSKNYFFRISAFGSQHKTRDQVLQTADPVDTDSFAGKIAEALNAWLGYEEEGRLAQTDQDAFERRTLAGGDDPGRIASQILDLPRGEGSHRQGTRHLDQFYLQSMFLEYTGIAGQKHVQKSNAERRIGHANFFGFLSEPCHDGMQN